MAEKNKNIELRSEKVRNIVGKVPPRLLRVGILIISFVIICILTLAYFIPYPQYRDIPVTLYSNPPIQTIIARNSGLFYSNIDREFVSNGERICNIKNDNDSIFDFYSKISGKILFNTDNGNYIQQNNILLSIIPDSLGYVYGIGLIPFDEIDTIYKGQKVTITYKGEYIIGEVINIYPIPEKGRFYKIEINFSDIVNDEDKTILLPNYIYSAKILISDKPLLKQVLNLN